MMLTRAHLTSIGRYAADALRMMQWFAVAGALYVVTFDLGLQETHPGLQATIYTLANITIRAWLGYWIARTALGRVDLDGGSDSSQYIARAIIIAGVVLTSR